MRPSSKALHLVAALHFVLGLGPLAYGSALFAMAGETGSSTNKACSGIYAETTGVSGGLVRYFWGVQDSLRGGRMLTLFFQDTAPSFSVIFRAVDGSQVARITGESGHREQGLRVPKPATAFELEIQGCIGPPVSLPPGDNSEILVTIRLEAGAGRKGSDSNSSQSISYYEVTITKR